MRFTTFITAVFFSTFAMTEAIANEFKEGQVWSYRARPQEQASTLLINKVETDPKLGSIFHISVRGVSVKNRRAPGGVTKELPHFPVSKKTLDDSVLEHVGSEPPNPEYREGYAQWKRAFDSGNAGIFTIPVAEIVGIVESTVNR
jgi:predicted Rdx family selenoprotein